MKNDLQNPNPDSVDELWISKPNSEKIKRWIDSATVARLAEFIAGIPENSTDPKYKKSRAYAKMILESKAGKP